MTNKKSEDEAANKANASETTKGEPSSVEENLEAPKEETVESEPEEEEIKSDYLGEEEPEPEKVDYKKRYGDSTREYQTLKSKTDTLSKAMENLESLVRLNPKIVAEIEEAQKSMPADNGTPSSTLIQQQIDKALEPVKKVAQDLENKDRMAKVKILVEFEKKNPKLFSIKATKKEKKEIRQRIGKVANALVETGMDYKDAVKRAYFTVNPKAAVQKGKDEAYLESRGEEEAGFSSQTSTEGKKAGKPKYTKAELENAKKFGDKYYKSMIKETK